MSHCGIRPNLFDGGIRADIKRANKAFQSMLSCDHIGFAQTFSIK